eukprot:scaffold473_cov132-Cylindrotheca_fusiformis.AAC.16
MIFRVSALARARAGAISHRYASSQVTTQTGSGLNAFAAACFGKSTARYATFLTVGVIGAELLTNGITDLLWEANNAGRTFQQVDWSKFDPEDEDEDDDDDDDDDDE